LLPTQVQDTFSRPAAISEARRVAPFLGEALRKRADLSRDEVARQLNVSAQTVSNWEQGKRRPGGDRAVAYLELLRELQRLMGTEPGN
jgi:DNA-binding transcriptional regulator YiaG